MLETINSISLLEYVYNRCQTSKKSDKVIVITSTEESDNELFDLCTMKNIPVYRGSLDNVLERYIQAAKYFDVDIVCRVCGDSPFVDVKAIDTMFQSMSDYSELEYMSTKNSLNGFTSEVFSLDVLESINEKNLTIADKEHVTKHIRDNIAFFKVKELDLNLKPKELENFTLTVDYKNDLNIAKKIALEIEGFEFLSTEVLNVLKNIGENYEL